MNWPDPFAILSLGELSMPTGYGYLFNPVPPALVAAGITAGLVMHARRGRKKVGIISAAILFIVAHAVTFIIAERYTLAYEKGPGCPYASDKGYVTLVPLFVPAAIENYKPGRSGFNGILCKEFDAIMWRDATPGQLATLAAMTFGLALTCFSLGFIFSWAGRPILQSKQTSPPT